MSWQDYFPKTMPPKELLEACTDQSWGNDATASFCLRGMADVLEDSPSSYGVRLWVLPEHEADRDMGDVPKGAKRYWVCDHDAQEPSAIWEGDDTTEAILQLRIWSAIWLARYLDDGLENIYRAGKRCPIPDEFKRNVTLWVSILHSVCVWHFEGRFSDILRLNPTDPQFKDKPLFTPEQSAALDTLNNELLNVLGEQYTDICADTAYKQLNGHLPPKNDTAEGLIQTFVDRWQDAIDHDKDINGVEAVAFIQIFYAECKQLADNRDGGRA